MTFFFHLQTQKPMKSSGISDRIQMTDINVYAKNWLRGQDSHTALVMLLEQWIPAFWGLWIYHGDL